MAEQKKERLAPAYVPWRTLMNYINSLRESGLPSQINRSVMDKTSYSGQAQLLAGMRYLGLIDTLGTPQAILAQWIEADEANQTKIIGKILSDCYKFVFDNLDLARASPAEVDKQFRERGIDGSTAERAVAFFLNAADAAGIILSPHLKKKTRSSGALRRTRSPRKRQRQEGNKPPAEDMRHDFNGGADPWLAKFPDFNPEWDEKIQQTWFEAFQKLMAIRKTGAAKAD
jgi:hypothetical protein